MRGADPESRIVTWPNAISALRLLGVPLFLWLLLAEQADALAFVVLAVAGATDWLDGYLARRLNQRTRLGVLLDPLVDRLYIGATIIGLALRSIIPWWLVALLVAREVMLLALVPRLRRQGRLALPVTYVGKAATFTLLWGFPLLLLGSAPVIGPTVLAIGWALALWGTFLYWWAGIRYVQQALAKA
ncbi:MAG TPA: CDP-diacylglycerol--glycerol-3-phosphate 3-phosphatidyltransferase [Actinobacteria bacterium]|jgi:cardiolipin synthase|nr:CDP-diacylglycerol--glycerol-3-phosphate 3-phosphatidyltransferase [Actinomycetota bacterium]